MRYILLLSIIIFGVTSSVYALDPYLNIELEDSSNALYLSETGDIVRIFSLTKFAEGHISIPIPPGNVGWKFDFSLLRSFANPSSRTEHDALYLDTPEFSNQSDEEFWKGMKHRRDVIFQISGFVEFDLVSKRFAFMLVDGTLENGRVLRQVIFMEKREGKWRLQSERPLGYGNLHNACKLFRFSTFAYFLTGDIKYLADSGMSSGNIDRLKVVRERVTAEDGMLVHELFYKYLKAVRFGVEDPDLAESVLVVYPPGMLHMPLQGITLNNATKTMIKDDLKGQVPRLASVVIEQTEFGGFRMAAYMLQEFSSLPHPERAVLIDRWTEANGQ